MADQCRHCKTELPENHKGPCPVCGKTGQIKHLKPRNAVSETSVTKPDISVSRTQIFFEKCWPILILVIVIGLTSPIITSRLSGLEAIGVGLALSVLSFILGLIAWHKVIKTERR